METKKKGRPVGINYGVTKLVKINETQNKKWNRNTPKLIRIVLENNPIELLKFYNDFFKDNIDYLLKNSKISEYILNHEEFDKIEEVIKRCQV